MSGRHFAVLIAPDGARHYVQHAAPGKTQDPDRATRFLTAQVAHIAGNRVVYGDSGAFWESERRASDNTRREHLGWKVEAEPCPPGDD